MMNPKCVLATLILLTATVTLTPQASAIAEEPNTKQVVSVETIYGNTWLELDAEAAAQAQLESSFPMLAPFTTAPENDETKDKKEDKETWTFQGFGSRAFERSTYLMNSSNGAPNGSTSTGLFPMDVPRVSKSAYRPAAWSGASGASSSASQFSQSSPGSSFVVPASAVVSLPQNQSIVPNRQLGSHRPIYSSVSESTFEGGRVSRVVPIPETNAIVPLLAVLGVIVAGPFIRRCIQP